MLIDFPYTMSAEKIGMDIKKSSFYGILLQKSLLRITFLKTKQFRNFSPM